ncbi:MAG: thiamine-binding protein [Spirochaetales bacterium]|nr:thiamine-binding protein [Spirochaetales bacterium]
MNVSLQILPLVPENQLYPVVDRVIAAIKASGVTYVVGPMETTMQGYMDELFEIVKQAHYICIEAGAERVAAMIKTDFRLQGVTIEEKTAPL